MSPVAFTGAFWPSDTQLGLLRSALADPPEAARAWEALRPDLDLRRLESGTAAVLPLVYRVLRARGTDETRLEHLKGVYRSTWVKNNLLAQRLAEAVTALETAGIEHRLIGGLSSAVRFYPEHGFRPTPTLELLVAPTAIGTAVRRLTSRGWQAAVPADPSRAPVVLSNPEGQTCLLEIEPAPGLALGGELLRSPPVIVKMRATEVAGVSAEHELLIACAAGARVRPVRSVQWLVDVAQIMASAAQTLDWARLGGLARAQRQVLRLQRSLLYLSRVVGVMPSSGAQELLALTPGHQERVDYLARGVNLPRARRLVHRVRELARPQP
jgi:hypothetical protein